MNYSNLTGKELLVVQKEMVEKRNENLFYRSFHESKGEQVPFSTEERDCCETLVKLDNEVRRRMDLLDRLLKDNK